MLWAFPQSGGGFSSEAPPVTACPTGLEGPSPPLPSLSLSYTLTNPGLLKQGSPPPFPPLREVRKRRKGGAAGKLEPRLPAASIFLSPPPRPRELPPPPPPPTFLVCLGGEEKKQLLLWKMASCRPLLCWLLFSHLGSLGCKSPPASPLSSGGGVSLGFQRPSVQFWAARDDGWPGWGERTLGLESCQTRRRP